MPEDHWFRKDEELVVELQESHRRESPRPDIAGYQDFVALDSGAQGAVFLACEEKGGRQVAIKVFHEQAFDSALSRRRFEREIYLVARLEHPNIVRPRRFGHCADGRPFLVMEYIRGRSLSEYVEDCSADEVLELMLQLAQALDHAHRRGVIHRDLKPGNVRVDREGNARLLDFGLAKPTRQLKPAGQWELSATGQFMGSLRWASPEQLRGHPDDVDTGTDVYSLGLLCFYCLTGELPYDTHGTVTEVAHNIEHSTPEGLRKLRPGLSTELETVLLRCLAKEPKRRYASMGELARDLGHVLAGRPIEARRDGLGYVLGALCKRYPWGSTAVAIGLLCLLGFSVITTGYYLRARDAEMKSGISLKEKDAALVLKEAALQAKRDEVDKVAAVNEFLLGSFLGSGVAPNRLGELRLQEVLTSAADRIESTPHLRQKPLVRADLHVAFAFWFSVLPDRLDEATAHACDALQLYEESEPAPSVQRAWAYEVRADTAQGRGETLSARDDYRAALAEYRRADADEMNIGRCLWRVAKCSMLLKENTGLLKTLEECLAIFTRQQGEEHANTRAIQATLDRQKSLSTAGP